jgi:hypothetical protein
MLHIQVVADKVQVVVEHRHSIITESFERLFRATEEQRLGQNRSTGARFPMRNILDQVTVFVPCASADDTKHFEGATDPAVDELFDGAENRIF